VEYLLTWIYVYCPQFRAKIRSLIGHRLMSCINSPDTLRSYQISPLLKVDLLFSSSHTATHRRSRSFRRLSLGCLLRTDTQRRQPFHLVKSSGSFWKTSCFPSTLPISWLNGEIRSQLYRCDSIWSSFHSR
jgi:hypothetical protein